ncbi:hypothetical protein MARPU_15535 [Marichromatium purpuratum 984]|uniref:Uncharacterized protein n=1 Tax=Marichromatium purpuratum 984 TaxID=765910 RepID=W0E463_MARPU|nr:hypothetical protein [Marichromatium purpuratum]AHF05645.1 hypothetical protein MARPU_15535 [Marichromatium purpuratum 984]
MRLHLSLLPPIAVIAALLCLMLLPEHGATGAMAPGAEVVVQVRR